MKLGVHDLDLQSITNVRIIEIMDDLRIIVRSEKYQSINSMQLHEVFRADRYVSFYEREILELYRDLKLPGAKLRAESKMNSIVKSVVEEFREEAEEKISDAKKK